MRKKILFITNSFPAWEYRRLWKKITSLASEDYKIFVISPKGDTKHTNENPNIKTFYYEKKKRKNTASSYIKGEISDFFKVKKLAFKIYFQEKFNAIHITNPTDTLALLGIIFKKFKCFFVYENNECNYEKYKDLKEKIGILDRLLILNLKILEKKIIKSADLIIVPSGRQRIRLARKIKEEKNKIVTVEPLPDLKDFYHPYLNQDYKMGYPKMVIYSGSLRLKRGAGKLLNVINFIHRDLRRKDILFVLAGGRKDRYKIKKYLREKNLDTNVYLPGWLNQKKLLTYLTAADLGIIIEDKENENGYFRDSLYEYMAVGKPVVSFNFRSGSSRLGEAASFIEGDNEILLAKEIIKILDNKEKKAMMGRIGQLKIEKQFNWLKSEIKLLSAYNQLLAEKKI